MGDAPKIGIETIGFAVSVFSQQPMSQKRSIEGSPAIIQNCQVWYGKRRVCGPAFKMRLEPAKAKYAMKTHVRFPCSGTD